MKNKRKTAIIGAGISGLYLAWKLAKGGQDITVFEKKGEIGGVVCSGLFSQRILNFLPQSEKLIQNKIDSVFLHFPKKTVKVSFSQKFLVMDHSQLDKLAAGLAQEAGAKIILNNNISSLPAGFDKIIGCDGGISFVRRELKLPDPKFRLGIQMFVNKACSDNFVDVWPCLKGFIWKIPRGAVIEYGIIESIGTAKKLFDDFLIKNNILKGKIWAKIIPQGLIIPSNEKITLSGDAAGLTKPWSGGGVVWGLIACEILLKSFPNFLLYKRKLKKFFLPKIILSKIALKLVYFLGFNLPWFLPKSTRIESDFLL